MIYSFTRLFGTITGLLFCSIALCQNLKTGVLVIGATPAGLAAAIQSAHSGVNTILIDGGNFESVVFTEEDLSSKTGTFAAFIQRVESAQKFPVGPRQEFSPAFTATIFKAWTDTIKNLKVVNRVSPVSIRKDGKGWQLVLNDKRELKADVIVDAGADNKIITMAGVSSGSSRGIGDSVSYNTNLYRTGVAINRKPGIFPPTLPASALLTSAENYFLLGDEHQSASLAKGQAAGAMAAYCSFFKKTSKDINIRLVQSELIGFKARLIHFDDVSDTDSNAVAIQSIALTGILKGKPAAEKFNFMPDSSVSPDEIKAPIKEYYSRSQIWFLDHTSPQLTLEDVLSLIKICALRGGELDREVEKGWNSSLKLAGKFDKKRLASRREVAVLFHVFLNPRPFAVDVNSKGNLVR